MIVAEEVKQAVQGEDLELGRVRVVSLRGLTPGNAGGDDEIAQKTGSGLLATGRNPALGGKRQDVSRLVFPAVSQVELTDLGV